MRTLEIHRLGRVGFADGLLLMRLAAERLRAGDAGEPDRIFLLEHPPVLTIGRARGSAQVLASPEWLAIHGFQVHEVDRGGGATYHGPGQVVGYPVVDLRDRPDVGRFVHDLEEAMIRTCADFGVAAVRHPRHRGAWVGRRKIGAVGVRLERWISGHGFALNVAPELANFGAIVPCGIVDPELGVTSLAAELDAAGRAPPPTAVVEERLGHHVAVVLARRPLERREAGLRALLERLASSRGARVQGVVSGARSR
jgi:lipoyl(octanoyl) transferase